jgi:hypothetical protein
MRAEPYAEAHERSFVVSRDRRQTPATLRALLRWAHRQYVAETPNLDHSGIHLDDDGAPTMAAAARRYLGLSKKDDRTDNWVELAGRTDEDGFYLTPLRLAIETQPRERRLFLRDLVPEVLFPSEVALLHGIPAWCMADVIHQSLAMLWRTFRERPPVRPNYLDRSEAQRSAEAVA